MSTRRPIFILILLSMESINVLSERIRSPVVLSTTSGLMEGVIENSVLGTEYVSFYGIPYAQPPIGNLRFKPPVPVEPWKGVFKADTKPLPCYQQYSKYGRRTQRMPEERLPRPWSEDCLKLNVLFSVNNYTESPIYFYLHGGGFSTGHGLHWKMPGDVVTFMKLVLITVNYRLGAFGFLNIRQPGASGNMGLIDQQMALKWVHRNAECFNAKKEAIFIIGDEAGGASAGYQALSPSNAGLFPTLVSKRGSPNCLWAYEDRESSIRKGTLFANDLGCTDSNVTLLIECLRVKHPEEIIDAAMGNHLTSFNFKPTVDGTFINESPTDILKSGKTLDVLHLIQSAFEEGSVILLNDNPDLLKTLDGRLSRTDFQRAVRRLIPNLNNVALSAIEALYLNWENPNDPIMLRDAAREVYSDYLTDCYINQYVHNLAASGRKSMRLVRNLYMNSPRKWMGSSNMSVSDCEQGFALAGERKGFTKAQQTTCEENLAYFGSVLRKKKEFFLDIVRPYNTTNRNYITIGVGKLEYKTHYRTKQCAFWDHLYPILT